MRRSGGQPEKVFFYCILVSSCRKPTTGESGKTRDFPRKCHFIDKKNALCGPSGVGAHAKVDLFQFVPGLPKTRSGKVMRRILRKVAEGDPSNLGDITTLADPGVVEVIVKGARSL